MKKRKLKEKSYGKLDIIDYKSSILDKGRSLCKC